MKLLISPAKKMDRDPDTLPWRDRPVLLERTERLLEHLRGLPLWQ